MSISFAPASLVANSKLPLKRVLPKLPAMRALKISPISWSNTTSGGTRESIQPRMPATGNWPDAVALTRAIRSRCAILPLTNRSFPSFNNSSAWSGVSWLLASFVIAGISIAGNARPETATAAAAGIIFSSCRRVVMSSSRIRVGNVIWYRSRALG